MSARFVSAMCAYAVLATLAGLTLDGKLRIFIWVLLAGFALKTYAAYRADW